MCERIVIVLGCLCPIHAGSGLSLCWGSSGMSLLTCVTLVLSRLCCTTGTVCGPSFGFRWSGKIYLRMSIPEEQNGTTESVSLPLLASYLLNTHFWL